jgi:hypothetical protein
VFAASASSVARPEPTIVRTAASRLPSSCSTVLESETSRAISSSWPSSESVRARSSVMVSTRPPFVSFSRRSLPSRDIPAATVSISERTRARPSSSRKSSASSKLTGGTMLHWGSRSSSAGSVGQTLLSSSPRSSSGLSGLPVSRTLRYASPRRLRSPIWIFASWWSGAKSSSSVNLTMLSSFSAS